MNVHSTINLTINKQTKKLLVMIATVATAADTVARPTRRMHFARCVWRNGSPDISGDALCGDRCPVCVRSGVCFFL